MEANEKKYQEIIDCLEDLIFTIKQRGRYCYFEITINVPEFSAGLVAGGEWFSGQSLDENKQDETEELVIAKNLAITDLVRFLIIVLNFSEHSGLPGDYKLTDRLIEFIVSHLQLAQTNEPIKVDTPDFERLTKRAKE